MSNGGRILGGDGDRRDKVGQAGDNCHIRLATDLPQRRSEDTDVATWDDLGALQDWIGTNAGLAHVPLDVGVAKE